MANKNSFLDALHPVYRDQAAFWRMQERRLRGGPSVLEELWPFEHETENGDQLRRRKAAATYLNFPDLFMRTVVGHLMRHAPKPDAQLLFGGLGKTTRVPGASPTRAELVYYNTDGAGQDGSQWDPFWARVMTWAGATGHRWVFCEASREAPLSEADEIAGKRPYLVHLSPLAVTNWDFDQGQLQMAIVRKWTRRLRIDANGELQGNTPEMGYLLMTRRGFQGFGPEYEAGGWWEFDADRNPIEGQSGTWDKTKGEIPMAVVYFERDEGETPELGNLSTITSGAVKATMSRSATFELGQLAISYMNLSSAADFDAWDAAASTTYLLNVTKEAYQLAVGMLTAGSRTVPVPGDKDSANGGPAVHDGSTGAVAANVFQTRLDAKRKEAMEIAAREASGSPDASGESKNAGFADVKAPLLARLASELETAQNTMIRFLELRFGIANPSGYVTWDRDFDLKPIVDDIKEHLDLERLTGLKSPTLDSQLMLRSARERRLVDDQFAQVVEAEYLDAAHAKREQDAQAAELARQFGLSGGPGF